MNLNSSEALLEKGFRVDNTQRAIFLCILTAAIVLLNSVIVATIPVSTDPVASKWLFAFIQICEFAIIGLLAYVAGKSS